jgi:uncharacterized protein (DUF885 family)
VVASLAAACSRNTSSDPERFSRLTQEFVETSLSFSPVAATGAGFHQHQGAPLDTQLDDFSPASLDRQRQFLQSFRARLAAEADAKLDPQQNADLLILQDQSELALLELDAIRNHRFNPTLYVETLGNGLFQPYLLNYAPLPERIGHIIARMEKTPAFLKTARANLQAAPEIWNRVAIEENEGTISLIENTLPPLVPPDMRPRYEAAAKPALEALRSFNEWLASDLSQRTADWRLGDKNYTRKFQAALGLSVSPNQLLIEAERALASVRKQMLDLAKPGHGLRSSEGDNRAEANRLIREALDRIATKHATPQTYLAQARRDLDVARVFVRDNRIAPLPLRDNLLIIETPEFMRGIYGVGGFSAAPAMQPELGAYYWITPIPTDWPPERIESKLREYNHYGLLLLTIHEAMPGHYVQLEIANLVTPLPRRVLRSVYGNGPYIEGWAVYVTEAMLDAGFRNNDPDLRLTFLKQQLRVISNAILDIRLHTRNLSDEDAMTLMVDSSFQEKEEATAKLQRAKLSSAQLPTYFAGYTEWVKLRDQQRRRLGANFNLFDFHQQALLPGAVPMRALAAILK